MGAIPQFGPDGPPALFFLGGYPGLALIAVYAVGAVPSRHVSATVGNATVGRARWPVGGLVSRKLVTIRREIVFPNTAYPCYAELQALVDAIVRRHPVRLVKKPTMSPQHNINVRRSAVTDRKRSGAELFSGPIGSFVPIFLAASGVATSRMLMRAIGVAEHPVYEALSRFQKVGIVRPISQGQRGIYWAIDPGFFAYAELRTLLLALARHYRPEYFALARQENEVDPRIAMHAATLSDLAQAHNLSRENDSQSVPRDSQSCHIDSQ